MIVLIFSALFAGALIMLTGIVIGAAINSTKKKD